MAIALHVRGLRKRYTVGAGACTASADVLRGIDLVLRAGEAIGVIGPAGSGKTTLLLCMAGLLRVDAGDLEWFGAADRGVARRRVVYHGTRPDLLRGGGAGEAHLHLVDVPDAEIAHRDAWLSQRCAAGDAVVVVERADAALPPALSRVLALRHGVLVPQARLAARVAESFANTGPNTGDRASAFVDPPSGHA
jgi:ABC-type cobalamin/Fe3+-siderophores transport system ATPase subunit